MFRIYPRFWAAGIVTRYHVALLFSSILSALTMHVRQTLLAAQKHYTLAYVG
jgi:hypothetical protein